jgi:hypothetical protein
MLSTALVLILEGIAALGALVGGWIIYKTPSPEGLALGVAVAVVPYCLCGIAQRHRLLTVAHEVRNRLPARD